MIHVDDGAGMGDGDSWQSVSAVIIKFPWSLCSPVQLSSLYIAALFLITIVTSIRAIPTMATS